MKQKVKLLISDEEIVNAACTSAQSFIDIDVAALRRAIEAAGVESIDDPSLDATDAAHPAWWRGQEAASKHWAARFSRFSLICDRLQTIADEAFGPFPTEPAETLMTLIEAGITALRVENAELERLRTLLASGQCVDLAKVTEHDFATNYEHASAFDLLDNHWIAKPFGDIASQVTLRQWLISKAGVKP